MSFFFFWNVPQKTREMHPPVPPSPDSYRWTWGWGLVGFWGEGWTSQQPYKPHLCHQSPNMSPISSWSLLPQVMAVYPSTHTYTQTHTHTDPALLSHTASAGCISPLLPMPPHSSISDEWVLIKADRVMKLKARPMAYNCSGCSIIVHISILSSSN